MCKHRNTWEGVCASTGKPRKEVARCVQVQEVLGQWVHGVCEHRKTLEGEYMVCAMQEDPGKSVQEMCYLKNGSNGLKEEDLA